LELNARLSKESELLSIKLFEEANEMVVRERKMVSRLQQSIESLTEENKLLKKELEALSQALGSVKKNGSRSEHDLEIRYRKVIAELKERAHNIA
jgi:regulator of replication initiation timing